MRRRLHLVWVKDRGHTHASSDACTKQARRGKRLRCLSFLIWNIPQASQYDSIASTWCSMHTKFSLSRCVLHMCSVCLWMHGYTSAYVTSVAILAQGERRNCCRVVCGSGQVLTSGIRGFSAELRAGSPTRSQPRRRLPRGRMGWRALPPRLQRLPPRLGLPPVGPSGHLVCRSSTTTPTRCVWRVFGENEKVPRNTFAFFAILMIPRCLS